VIEVPDESPILPPLEEEADPNHWQTLPSAQIEQSELPLTLEPPSDRGVFETEKTIL